MPITDYNYIQAPFRTEEIYTCFRQDGFIQVNLNEGNIQNAPNNANFVETQTKTGWKIHVSIDDRDINNLGEGWRIVSEILIRNFVYLFKIIDNKHLPIENYRNKQNTSERGKHITIYSFKQPQINWRLILQEITEELAANNIVPSYLPISDNPIQGSQYLSYRYEGATLEEFVVPEGVEDIFAGVQINVDNQLPRPEWGLEIQENHLGEENPLEDQNLNEEGSKCCRLI